MLSQWNIKIRFQIYSVNTIYQSRLIQTEQKKKKTFIYFVFTICIYFYFNSDYFVFSLELTLIFKAIHQVSSQFLP